MTGSLRKLEIKNFAKWVPLLPFSWAWIVSDKKYLRARPTLVGWPGVLLCDWSELWNPIWAWRAAAIKFSFSRFFFLLKHLISLGGKFQNYLTSPSCSNWVPKIWPITKQHSGSANQWRPSSQIFLIWNNSRPQKMGAEVLILPNS